MRSRHSQSGLTLIGFVFVAAVVLSIAMIGFRVVPSYIEYFSVEKVLRQTLQDSPENVTLSQFRSQFLLKASADYIDSVGADDLDLKRDGNRFTATADWTTTLPLIGNVSLLLEFHASASK